MKGIQRPFGLRMIWVTVSILFLVSCSTTGDNTTSEELGEHQKNYETLEQDLEEVENELEGKEDRLKEVKKELDKKISTLEEKEDAVVEANQLLEGEEKKLNDLEVELEDKQDDIEVIEGKIDSKESELEEVVTAIQENENELTNSGTTQAQAEEHGPIDEENSPADHCVDINSASAQEVQNIKHIGQVRAEYLINARPFNSVDDLQKVKGIGPSRIADIKAEGVACVQ